jgi:hypothetical protein
MENRWGLPLAQYLNKTLAKRHGAYHVTLDEARRSTSQLQTDDYVSISVLEDILLLARFPRHLQMLHCPEMIQGCVRILKNYCDNHRVRGYVFSDRLSELLMLYKPLALRLRLWISGSSGTMSCTRCGCSIPLQRLRNST